MMVGSKMKAYHCKLTLTSPKGVKEIDLTPVKELENRLEKALKKRETWKDRSHVPIILEIKKDSEKLNKDQQKYFTSHLLNKVQEYYDLFLFAIEDSEEGIAYNKLIKKAKSLI